MSDWKFLFCFCTHFLLGLFHIEKNFNISKILVKWQLEKLHLHPKWVPNTHDDPHKTGARRKATQPLFVQKKNIFETIKSILISD